MLTNSNGFKDFCIKDLKLVSYGRKEIEIAEKGAVKMNFHSLYFICKGGGGGIYILKHVHFC